MAGTGQKKPRLAVVGPCGAGKSTLVEELRQAGYSTRHIAQEHSYVPDMWQRLYAPDLLIYLDVDFPNAVTRRPRIRFGPERLADQVTKLAHARTNADLYIDTSELEIEEVRRQVFAFLEEREG